MEIWSLFLIAMARIVPLIALAPFFGGKMVPDSIKIGFGASVVLIFFPYIIGQSTADLSMDLTLIFLMIKEAFIGLLLGFLISVPFYFAQGAGALIDHQRGSQSLQVMDPSTQMQTSPLGTLYNDMLLVIFFFIGGPLLFFEGVFTSYAILPADQFIPPSFFDASRPLWGTAIQLLHNIVALSLQLATPSVMAMLLSDLFLGITNRMAPQVQISFLLWSLKAFIGIALLFLAWWYVIKQLDIITLDWIKTFHKIIVKF